MRRALSLVFLSVVVAAACGATTNQLRTRAAYDLRCTDAELHVIDMDSRTDLVVGCGKQATYTTDCQDQGLGAATDCTWRIDPASMRDAPAPGTEGGLCKQVGEHAFSCAKGLACHHDQCVREL